MFVVANCAVLFRKWPHSRLLPVLFADAATVRKFLEIQTEENKEDIPKTGIVPLSDVFLLQKARSCKHKRIKIH